MLVALTWGALMGCMHWGLFGDSPQTSVGAGAMDAAIWFVVGEAVRGSTVLW